MRWLRRAALAVTAALAFGVLVGCQSAESRDGLVRLAVTSDLDTYEVWPVEGTDSIVWRASKHLRWLQAADSGNVWTTRSRGPRARSEGYYKGVGVGAFPPRALIIDNDAGRGMWRLAVLDVPSLRERETVTWEYRGIVDRSFIFWSPTSGQWVALLGHADSILFVQESPLRVVERVTSQFGRGWTPLGAGLDDVQGVVVRSLRGREDEGTAVEVVDLDERRVTGSRVFAGLDAGYALAIVGRTAVAPLRQGENSLVAFDLERLTYERFGDRRFMRNASVTGMDARRFARVGAETGDGSEMDYRVEIWEVGDAGRRMIWSLEFSRRGVIEDLAWSATEQALYMAASDGAAMRVVPPRFAADGMGDRLGETEQAAE